MYRIIIFIFLAQLALADVVNNFGAGGSSLGSAQGVRYSEKDLLSNIHTPAALVDIRKPSFAVGVFYSKDEFKDLSSVVTDSLKYGSSSQSVGDVDTDTPDLTSLILGVYMPSGDGAKSGLSLFATMPFGKILSVETTSAYYPQYMMYQSDGQRMNAAVNYSRKTKSDWDYSLGFHLFFATGSTVVSRFPSSTSGQPSSSNIDLKVDVKPAFAPSFSLRKKWNSKNEFSLSFVGERDAKLAFKANNNINVFVTPIPINVDGSSSLYYDPVQLNLSWKRDFSRGALFFGLEWERWSQFSSSVMIMQITGTASFEQLNIDQRFKDIYIPRLAWRSSGDQSWWTVGYSYRPSPILRSIDESNYLDSDKHVLGASYQRKSNRLMGFIDYKHSWGLAFGYHRLNDRFVSKTETDSVGYPGYKISGQVFNLGLYISAEI